jgi:hypothetical protein
MTDDEKQWLDRLIRSIPRRLDDIGPEGPPEHSGCDAAHDEDADPARDSGTDDTHGRGRMSARELIDDPAKLAERKIRAKAGTIAEMARQIRAENAAKGAARATTPAAVTTADAIAESERRDALNAAWNAPDAIAERELRNWMAVRDTARAAGRDDIVRRATTRIVAAEAVLAGEKVTDEDRRALARIIETKN